MSNVNEEHFSFMPMSIDHKVKETEEKAVTDATPRNCKNPCCYGTRRNMCWPCMKELMKDQSSKNKR